MATLSAFITYIISFILVRYCECTCNFYLSQSDFDIGTFRITKSGTYCLKENIIFNPNYGTDSSPNAPNSWLPNSNKLFPGSEDHKSGAFSLGFFAVITIETNNVIIDLYGYEIKYDYKFYLQQRWGSIIQIGNSAFLPNAGPANFPGSEGIIIVHNIEIRNGILGLSSHHGIHSHSGRNITISNLIIKDFEVGGIQLNGFEGAKIENVEIGPSLDTVPLTGMIYTYTLFLYFCTNYK